MKKSCQHLIDQVCGVTRVPKFEIILRDTLYIINIVSFLKLYELLRE